MFSNKMRNIGTAPHHQRGAANLLALLFSIVILSTIIFGVIIPMIRDSSLRTSATIAGNYLAQYNTAIRHFYAYNDIATIPTGNRTGTDWLKNISCFGGTYSGTYSAPEAGNPAQGFLPCEFPNIFGFGVTPTTTLTVAASVFSATTRFGPIRNEVTNEVDYVLATHAWRAANAENWDEGTKASGVFFSYTINMNDAAPDFGVITALATSNFSVADVYLPRNGSQPMAGTLDMDGNDINNVKDLAGTGSAVFQEDIISGRDVLVNNEIISRGNVVTTTGNMISAQGDVVAGAGDVVARQGNIIANNNLETRIGDVISRDAYIRSVTIDGRAARVSQAVFDKRVVESTSIVQAPVCPNGDRALIFAVPEAWVSGSSARQIYGVHRWLQDLGGGQWRVNLLVLIQTGAGPQWYILPPANGLLNVSAKCP